MAGSKFSGMGAAFILTGGGLIYLAIKNLKIGDTVTKVLRRQPINTIARPDIFGSPGETDGSTDGSDGGIPPALGEPADTPSLSRPAVIQVNWKADSVFNRNGGLF